MHLDFHCVDGLGIISGASATAAEKGPKRARAAKGVVGKAANGKSTGGTATAAPSKTAGKAANAKSTAGTREGNLNQAAGKSAKANGKSGTADAVPSKEAPHAVPVSDKFKGARFVLDKFNGALLEMSEPECEGEYDTNGELISPGAKFRPRPPKTDHHLYPDGDYDPLYSCAHLTAGGSPKPALIRSPAYLS